MKNAFKKGSWLFTVPIALIGLVYLYFIFLPSQRHIDQQHEQLAQQRAAVRTAQLLETNVHTTRQQLTEAQKQVAGWRDGKLHDHAAVLAAINQSIRASGMQTIQFDPEKPEPLESIERTHLALETRGTFPQIFEMLRQFEAMNASIWVEELRIVANGDNPNDLSSELSLAIFAGKSGISD